MTYFPDAIPGPEPTIDDQAFWEYCKAGELRFKRSRSTGLYQHPPTADGALDDWEWVPAQGVPELYSFTIVNYSSFAGITAEMLPYNVAIVRYPENGDVRVISNVIDAAPEDMVIGMPLELVWQDTATGIPVPRYRRAGGTG